MDNKKLGVILMILGVIIVGVFIYYNKMLIQQGISGGCVSSEAECIEIERNLSFIHIGIGIFAFLFALGFYILFFNKSEERLIKRLEDQKDEEKFNFALKFLDPSEAKVLKMIREQDGITQSTLRVKLDMSKAKLSYVLQDLEKRGLVKRVKKGKTLSVYSKL